MYKGYPAKIFEKPVRFFSVFSTSQPQSPIICHFSGTGFKKHILANSGRLW